MDVVINFICGGQGLQNSLKNHKNIGFLGNTGQDPLKNNEAASQVFNCWVIIGTSLKSKWHSAGVLIMSLIVKF